MRAYLGIGDRFARDIAVKREIGVWPSVHLDSDLSHLVLPVHPAIKDTQYFDALCCHREGDGRASFTADDPETWPYVIPFRAAL